MKVGVGFDFVMYLNVDYVRWGSDLETIFWYFLR